MIWHNLIHELHVERAYFFFSRQKKTKKKNLHLNETKMGGATHIQVLSLPLTRSHGVSVRSSPTDDPNHRQNEQITPLKMMMTSSG